MSMPKRPKAAPAASVPMFRMNLPPLAFRRVWPSWEDNDHDALIFDSTGMHYRYESWPQGSKWNPVSWLSGDAEAPLSFRPRGTSWETLERKVRKADAQVSL